MTRNTTNQQPPTTSGSIDVRMCECPADASLEAAKIIQETVKILPSAKLGLCTGRTPTRMYKTLAEMYHSDELDLSRVTTFNLDEYCGLPHNTQQSFRSYMQTTFFDHVNIPAGNVNFPGCEKEGANKFERKIVEVNGIDLQVLGIGVNGHIAFNEPGSSLDSRTRIVDLSESTIEENFPDHAHDIDSSPPTQAVTMGTGTILEAKCILLLATGQNKARAIQRALHGPITESCPASALRLHSRVTVLIDKEAGRFL